MLRNRNIKFACVALAALLLSLSLGGCFISKMGDGKPHYYKDEEILTYLQQTIDPDLTFVSKEEQTDEPFNYFLMIYRLSDGTEFAVESHTKQFFFDATPTRRYDPTLSIRYFSARAGAVEEKIKDIIRNYSLSDEREGRRVILGVSSREEYERALDCIVELDACFAFHYDRNAAVEPLDAIVDDYSFSLVWKPEEKYLYGGRFSVTPADRRDRQTVERCLNPELADAYRFQQISNLELTDQELEAYPYHRIAEIIWPAEINLPLVFNYSSDLKKYVIAGLDPCQDFDGYPLSYAYPGSFCALVEAYGGTYQCDNYRAEWTIGEDHWEAQLELKQTRNDLHEFTSFTCKKNGTPLKLDAYDGSKRNAQTPTFSKRDLEQMLNCTIEIDQRAVRAVFR